MSYPQRGASYKHEPKFLKELAGAESGVGRLQKAHNQAQPLRGARAEGGGVDGLPKSDGHHYDLRKEDGLTAAKHKLNELGLGRTVVLSPSAKEKE